MNAKRKALNLITLMKKKRSGKIKGRACADGRKQRHYITKDEIASPTVQLQSPMLSLLIEYIEQRCVATADVVGAYLLAVMNDCVLVKLTGNTLHLMGQVNNKYEIFFTYENKKISCI